MFYESGSSACANVYGSLWRTTAPETEYKKEEAKHETENLDHPGSCGAALADQSGTLTSTISWALTDDGALTCASENSLSFSPTLSGSCGDNVTWSYSNGTLTISGTGPMWDYDFSSDASPFRQDTRILTATIGNGVTSIGAAAFASCGSLTKVSISNSVIYIEDQVFYKCGLKSITLPSKLTKISYALFDSCRDLSSVTIPNNVTTIDSSAFYRCSGLTSLTIPDSVTSKTGIGVSVCMRQTDDEMLAGGAGMDTRGE